MTAAQPWMESTQLLDCTGTVTHTLTLLVDGTVRVAFREGHTVIIDPLTKTCLTPGVHVHADLLNAAATLRVP